MPDVGKFKVLVIDDEPDFVALMKSRLEADQFEVLTASNGVEGIALLEEERPDLIVLDVLMPFINGLNFVKIIKKYDDFKSIPIIVLTAKIGMEELFQKEGVHFYITKPFGAQDLIKKVREVVPVNGSPSSIS